MLVRDRMQKGVSKRRFIAKVRNFFKKVWCHCSERIGYQQSPGQRQLLWQERRKRSTDWLIVRRETTGGLDNL